MNDLTILSTACGAMFMPGFFKCIKENGEVNIRIIGVDSAPVEYMKEVIDGFYRVPSISDPNYIKTILAICKEEKVDIVFPHISMELESFARYKKLFEEEGIKLAISNSETLTIANNKLALYKRLNEAGLSCPDFMEIKDVADFDNAIKHFGFPQNDFCIKIADGSGQRGVRIVSNKFSVTNIFLTQKPSNIYITAHQMRSIIDEINGSHSIMAMECLYMPEYTVDLLADKGDVIAIGGRLNTESSMSIAQQTEVMTIPEAFSLCKSITEMLALDGNVGFDFMFDTERRPVLTDLNPRVTATVILFKEAGLNLPFLRIKQLLNQPFEVNKPREGVKLIRKYDDIIVS